MIRTSVKKPTIPKTIAVHNVAVWLFSFCPYMLISAFLSKELMSYEIDLPADWSDIDLPSDENETDPSFGDASRESLPIFLCSSWLTMLANSCGLLLISDCRKSCGILFKSGVFPAMKLCRTSDGSCDKSRFFSSLATLSLDDPDGPDIVIDWLVETFAKTFIGIDPDP